MVHGDQRPPSDRDMFKATETSSHITLGTWPGIEPPNRHRRRSSPLRVLGGLAAITSVAGAVALLHSPTTTPTTHPNTVTPGRSELAVKIPNQNQTTVHTEYQSGTLLGGILTWRTARLTVTAGGSTATALAVGVNSTSPPDSAADATPPSCIGLVSSDTHTGVDPTDPVLAVTATQTSDGAVVHIQRSSGPPPHTITVNLTTCDSPPVDDPLPTGESPLPPPTQERGAGLRPVMNG